MYARTSSWTGTPEALEKWAEQMAGSVAPMVGGVGCVISIGARF